MKVGRVPVFSCVCPLLCVEFVTRSAVPVLFYTRHDSSVCVRGISSLLFPLCFLFRRAHASPRESWRVGGFRLRCALLRRELG